MDDLDRLYHRLVLHVRDGAPHLLDQRFRLGDIAAHLVPYRHTRRELGFESIQQYEHAVMRLASGERGYLRAESAVQDALRRSLAEPQPDGSLLRAYADAAVALPPDALVRARVASPEDGDDSRPPGTTPAVEPAPAARPTPSATHAPVPAAADLERAVVASSQAADAWTDSHAVQPPRPMTNPTHHPPAPSPAPSPGSPASSAAGRGVLGGSCRYCGQALPEGRRITFCPYCGNNVTVVQCPACSTELEVGWKFCITCGRSMDDAALTGGP